MIVSQQEITTCIPELLPSSFNVSIKADDIGTFNLTVSAEVLPSLDDCKPAVYQGVRSVIKFHPI